MLAIGKGTVYRYFATKQDLFLAAVDLGLASLSNEIDMLFGQEGRDPLDLVRDAVTAYLKFFRKHPEMAELFIQERAVFRDRHTPLYFAGKYKNHDRDVPFIKALIRLGRLRKVKPVQVLDVVSDMLYGTVLSNHLAGRDADPKKQASAILDVLFHGILSDSERKRIANRAVQKRRAGAALAGIAFMFLSGCSGVGSPASADRAESAIAVTVEPVSVRPLVKTVSAVGTLNGYEETTLSPKVEGRIISIRADIGDRVGPGSVLLELDPNDYDLAIVEATQALAAELARLGLTALPPGAFDVSQVPSVKRSAASYDDAARRLKTKKTLGNAASPDEVDQLETEVRIAEAIRNHTITEALSTLAAARLRKASLDLAKQRRADCALSVPVPSDWLKKSLPKEGLKYAVAQRMVSEGEMVRSMPVTNAFKLVLDFKLKLKALIPEKHVSEVSVGQPVEVKTDAYAGRIFKGVVARVNPTIDSANRTFLVEIEIENGDGALKCGGFAKASIQTKSDVTVLTVPPPAVVSFAGVNKVFVMEGDHAKAVEVEIGTRDKDWIEVRGNFPRDARVITSGLSRVVDGSDVRIR